ncbi:hypothetical protein [Paraburkholderia sp. J12]|uniref:hypothetical protein n=1 Tax=Paraburkholderia sp. J12 TaxID=2805432 RepID=UPI002ABD7C43|nr:hypothetical protein [Paraburkholderia sp. J12]
MSSVFGGRLGSIANGDVGALHRWTSLHAWNGRQRLGVFVALAVLTAGLAVIACVACDFTGLHTAEAALADAERALPKAQQTVASLPALRAAAASRATMPRLHPDSAAGDLRGVSELAARSGLSLLSLEPAAAGGSGVEVFRTFKLTAQGGFAQMQSLLVGLTAAPGLIVPVEISIKRNAGSGLSITAAMQVFERLPAIHLRRQPDGNEVSQIDPFAEGEALAAGTGSLRLAGTLQDDAGIVALLETPTRTEAVKSGQPFGSGRIEQITPTHVLLSSGGANQRLAWAEEPK